MVTIKEALDSLDPKVDANWTDDGAPMLTVISGLVGSPVTRKQITEAAPGFSRKSAVELVSKPQTPVKEDYLSLPDREFYAKISNFKDFELEDILVELSDKAKEISEQFKILEDTKELVMKRRGWVREKLTILKPPMSNQDAIQAYLEKQKELQLGSTLSKVMARRTGFGGKRPTYPIKG